MAARSHTEPTGIDPAAVHVIGVTGGIASGKSTVAKLLQQRGAVVVDADQLARHIVEPGQPALAQLVERFGTEILTADGALDRKRLGAIVFSDASARSDLDRIMHPRIAAASAQAIRQAASAGARVVFYEAALLVETRRHLAMSGLVVVTASPEIQLSRIMARDSLSAADAQARIAAQAPVEAKLQAATWVIHNDGPIDDVKAQLDDVIADIERKFGPFRI